ncbi:janus kinase and microtubule-interacting 1-like protein [Labeo rohita]|uniref:Janus kinase and microtubule-interacting 1-like protein n=1 Tax=Labeo rohita TaxID=84645 RepID=A0A498MGX0_LABRO|nr:janus kinase and microtubule-interacting 1-like protein [Labeo rohita]
MAATTPTSAPPPKKSRGKQEVETLQAANEELRSRLSDLQNELQQERGKVGKLRERLQELRAQRETEQHKHSVALTELRVKLHEEKQREVAATRESLSRQHETELARAGRLRETELARLQALVCILRDGASSELRNALKEEAREEARRSYEAEKLRLTQELQEAKTSRRQAEEALSNAVQADRAKAADLRVAHQAHQDEIQRIKRESEREIRRLMDELKSRDRVVQSLEKELGVQAGQTQRLLLQKEESERHYGSPKREVAPSLGENSDSVNNQDVDEKDVRRFQLKIAELQAVIRKLEDRNTLLSDERNELLKRVRETDAEIKPLMEKNKRLNKKNEELQQTLQRMEDKLKTLSRESAEQKEKSQQNLQPGGLKRHTSLTDLSHAHEQQEVEYLRLQINEQRGVIDELTQRHVVETYFGFDEESVDSETSSLTSYNTDRTDHTPATPEEDLEDGFSREEAELRFRQLTREYQALQRAYALLQETTGPLDPERHCRTREQLQTELIGCQARIADLERSLAEKGQDVIIPDLMKKLDILGDNGNLRNEEQVTVIQAGTVLSLCEKWLKQIDSTEAALTQKMIDLENEKRVQELEATLYAALQQDPDSCVGESLSDRQRAKLAESMDAVRRQILRQSRHADTLVLQQRMELLQSAQQRIRELEDKIDMQRRQIKEIEEKVCMDVSFSHVYQSVRSCSG